MHAGGDPGLLPGWLAFHETEVLVVKSLTLVLLFWLVSPAFAQCIGVITAGGGQAYWQDVEQGAVKAAAELEIAIYTRGAADEINVQAQEALINWIVNIGCRGLVLAPNSDSHRDTIARLKAEGIPTVFVDRDIGGERVSVIKTNNDKAGELAGREMIKALGGRGKVAVFRMDREVQTTTARENAFIRTIENAGMIVAVEAYIGTRVGNAREKAYELLITHPDIDGIFTPNESTSLGTMAAINQLGRDHQPVHIGFDASPMLTNAMESGNIQGLVVQSPFQMGYQGVHTVYRAMQGQPVEENYEVPVVFLVKADL